MTFPHALLRAGFPFVKTLGMRRSTYFPADLAVGEDRVYVVVRMELGNPYVRVVSQDDDDLGRGGPRRGSSGRRASCSAPRGSCSSPTRARTRSSCSTPRAATRCAASGSAAALRGNSTGRR